MISKTAIMAFAVLISWTANAFYGFSANPADQSTWCDSCIYAENAYQLKMIQPDGVTRLLQRDPGDVHTLICPEPWVGEIRGRQTLVMTRPGFEGGQTGFLFENGLLKQMILDGREISVKSNAPCRGSLDSLWPTITDEMVATANARYRIYWDRLTLWFDNPNFAAMFLVEVFLLAMALTGARKKCLWLVTVPVMVVCFIGLVKTNSRSGMLGLVGAFACYAAFRARALLTVRRVLLLLLCLAGIGVYLHVSGSLDRFTSGMINEGYSDVSRIPIWREVPRMMVASFSGWGLGNSGIAYMNWFQPLDRFHCVHALISGHFTWLVEFGWPMRVCYVFLWMAGLFCLAKDAFRGRNVLPVAMWTAFFVGAIFNSTEQCWSLWLIPLGVLVIPLASRPWRRAKEYLVPLGVGGLLTIGILGIFVFLGLREQDQIPVVGNGNRVIVNGKSTQTWVVDDGYVLDGGCFGVLGKDVRGWYQRHREAAPIGFVKRLDCLTQNVERLVLAGRAGRDFLSAYAKDPKSFATIKSIIFVSPPFGWKSVPAEMLADHQVKMIVGSLAARYNEKDGKHPEWLKSVPGCALYINGWLRYVTR